MSTLQLGKDEARRFLARYHFAPTDVAGVFARLGSVQYDPLKPVGRNHDLVLQARVPGYRVDDWEKAAYGERIVYDAWDKQACLVPVSDWPHRRIYHEYFRPAREKRVLEPHANVVAATLEELRERGPLSSLDFEDQGHHEDFTGSWYGPKLVKQVLRALWDTGRVVTHHRDKGRHVYHLAEEVIPPEHFCKPPADREENLRWLIKRRHQSVGLLRPGADGGMVWSMPAYAKERLPLVEQLVESGELTAVNIEGRVYHMLTDALPLLDAATVEPRMSFVAPLDSLVWDRKAVKYIFDFDYVWEVYVPEAKRKWGYYVLPVFYRDRFVARLDSRLIGKTWHVHDWWWEEGVAPNTDMLAALELAVRDFMAYLGASKIRLPRRLDKTTKEAMRAGAKL